jgi:hypothetical protein
LQKPGRFTLRRDFLGPHFCLNSLKDSASPQKIRTADAAVSIRSIFYEHARVAPSSVLREIRGSLPLEIREGAFCFSRERFMKAGDQGLIKDSARFGLLTSLELRHSQIEK